MPATAEPFLPHYLLPMLVKRVLFHHLIKLWDMGCMAPWFVTYLSADTLCKPRTPAKTWECRVDTVAGIFVNKVAKVLNSFVFSSIIVQSGKLDQLSHECDGTVDAHLPNVSGYFVLYWGLKTNSHLDVERLLQQRPQLGHPQIRAF
jgi:hypothetical protein